MAALVPPDQPYSLISSLQGTTLTTPNIKLKPQKPKQLGYYDTPKDCHPARQHFKCPITLFIILMIIGAVVNIWAWLIAPHRDKMGYEIPASDYWIAIILGVSFHFLVIIIGAWIIFEQCRRCNVDASWIVFLLAVLLPVVSALLVGLIIGQVLGVGFLWTARKEPNKDVY